MLDPSVIWQGAIGWLSAHAAQPVLSLLHVAPTSLAPDEVAEAGLIAVIQLCVIGLVLQPLETIFPAERWTDRKLAAIDRNYTLLMLLGLFPLLSFLVLSPLAAAFGIGGDASQQELTGLRHWVPWFQDHPYALFAIYYVLYDLAYYVMHRLQHALPWWWALHSMHHSQRQMSCWANDRTSYVDGVLQSLILAMVGIAMGVDPSQFALLVLLSELMQSLSHANLRLGFGRVLERVFVDPRFHRLHHMRRNPERPLMHNCNFGQVLSVWDVLFGTALYGEPVRPTGVGDPTVDADNGRGLVAQQWYTLRRFWRTVRCLDGWRPGEVSFAPDFSPVRDGLHDTAQRTDAS